MKSLLRKVLLALLLAGAAGLFAACGTRGPAPADPGASVNDGWNTGRNFGSFGGPFPSNINNGR
jgi:predicted small lipoprotein YifL